MNNNLIPVSELQIMARSMGCGIFGKTPEQMLALMFLAQAQGRHPALVAVEYDVIQGRPAINSKSALSKFQSSGGKIKWIERTDLKCSAEFYHEQGGTLTVEWTFEMAKKAGLSTKQTRDNSPNMWQKYPRQMLTARVIAEGVRTVFPACLDGLYTVEEVNDFEEPKQQTQKPVITEAVVIDEQVKQAMIDPLEDRVCKMLDYLKDRGISEEQVLNRIKKTHCSFIDEYDLETIKALIKGSKDLNLDLDVNFPAVQELNEPCDPIELNQTTGIKHNREPLGDMTEMVTGGNV